MGNLHDSLTLYRNLLFPPFLGSSSSPSCRFLFLGVRCCCCCFFQSDFFCFELRVSQLARRSPALGPDRPGGGARFSLSAFHFGVTHTHTYTHTHTELGKKAERRESRVTSRVSRVQVRVMLHDGRFIERSTWSRGSPIAEYPKQFSAQFLKLVTRFEICFRVKRFQADFVSIFFRVRCFVFRVLST